MHPRSIDEFLCSVELHAPSQERALEHVTLFAVVSFDIGRLEIAVDDEIRDVRYGFVAAKLRLELKQCTIAPQGRYRETISPRRLVTERIREDGDEHAVNAAAKARIPLLPVFGASAGIRAGQTHANKLKVTEQDEDAFDRPVVEPHGHYWRVYGVKHPQGVLSGQITGDEPLCKIVPSGTLFSVKALLDADLHDLWIDTQAKPSPLEVNRNTVCTLLIAKSLRKSKVSLSGERRTVSLADHTLQIKLDEGDTDAGD